MKIIPSLILAAVAATTLSAAPKKLLVVTTTTGFRHSSIPTLEKVIAQLGKSSGEFSVDFVHQPDPMSEQALKDALQKLSPESLKNYDGVMFASTTGDLPIPDREGLLNWIKAGHAFIGIHAASDTFHNWPEFIQMLGGEFQGHGAQVSVECLNQDPKNPANAHLGKSWTIEQEEVYEFKSYDATKVHDLLILDKHPQNKAAGHFPVSWNKAVGAGKIFYTSLGHREDLIDTDPDLKDRKNSIESSKLYQQHVLGGIEWALGLKHSAP
ncbi:MAG: ThuA domain-containing protein [Verrucomicrobia bacterium]|nr:MAG: ThuA domain-containing protein [Verrucomicrobiota bacterium]